MSLKHTTIVAAGFALAAPAFAADLPTKSPAAAPAPAFTMFDFAAGGKIMSDYNFRGISQSDRKPSGTAYFEGRINFNETFQFYVATQAYAVKLPSDPSAEVDLSGGVRATFGSLVLDVGVMRYWYPGETEIKIANGAPFDYIKSTDFTEFYGKATYTFNDMFTFGANVFYASNWLNTGATGTYTSATAKVTLPYDFSVSGELGRYFLGTTDAFYGFTKLPDYTYWNVGLTYTYKALSLDLRYHDTNLSKTECSLITGNNAAIAPIGIGNRSNSSNWCSAAFIATLSADITGASLK
jgi:uncharacterized protein (TIGR02001 family)